MNNGLEIFEMTTNTAINWLGDIESPMSVCEYEDADGKVEVEGIDEIAPAGQKIVIEYVWGWAAGGPGQPRSIHLTLSTEMTYREAFELIGKVYAKQCALLIETPRDAYVLEMMKTFNDPTTTIFYLGT